jgi:hypothetical protein
LVDGLTLEARFHQALNRLCTWYADSTRAISFDGPSIAHTKPGAVELRLQSYPDLHEWKHRWRGTRSDAEREAVIAELEAEYQNLSQSPSGKHTHVLNTLEWKVAIANHEGEARYVARFYGVGLSTVYKYRKMHRQAT